MANPACTDRLYRRDIDGLRAIAILSVVLFHCGAPLVTGGYTGVDIFFVISGYLIGGHIYSELLAGNFSFLHFYRRRAKRILPAFYTVLAFTTLAALFLLTPLETASFGRSAFAATLSVSNILFWKTTSYFNPSNELNPLLMTWSLGVEEQFYLVIPMLMTLLLRLRRSLLLPAILAICILSFLFAWCELNNRPVFVFYMLPARAWELGIGILLAVAELTRKRALAFGLLAQVSSLIGLTLMLVPVVMLTKTTPFPGAAALPSVLGTALVISVPASWINRTILSNQILVSIGRVSYSWYLWHWPLLAYLRILYGSKPPLTASVLASIAALATAVLSYYLIERPFRNSVRTPSAILLRYAALSAVFLLVFAAFWLSDGVSQRFPALARAEAELGKQRVEWRECLLGTTTDAEIGQNLACYNAQAPSPSVALWGDSHAASLAPGLRSVANAQGYSFAEFSMAACPPLIGAAPYSPVFPAEEAACFQFNRKAFELIATNHNIGIVILVSYWALPIRFSVPGRDNFRSWLVDKSADPQKIPKLEASQKLLVKSLKATIHGLEAAGKKVIIIDDYPNFEFDPLWRVQAGAVPARHALAVWLGLRYTSDPGFGLPYIVPEDAVADSAIKEAVASFPDVELVDLESEMCGGSSHCVYRNGDHLLYLDYDHLTGEGARYALRNFRLPTISVL